MFVVSHVRLFVIPWTEVCQAPLSIKFSRQERILDWVAIPSPGNLPDPGIKHACLMPELEVWVFKEVIKLK